MLTLTFRNFLPLHKDFEDAEEEELAALEAQRAEAKQLDEADLWDMEDEDVSHNIIEGTAEIANGSRAAQNYHHKSGPQRLDLMMNEAPELRGLLARLKSSLSQLVGTIGPLCRYV